MEDTNTLPQWRRSEFCGTQACVEVATTGMDTFLIRDSKNPDAPALAFDRTEWHAFVAGVRAGNFDFD